MFVDDDEADEDIFADVVEVRPVPKPVAKLNQQISPVKANKKASSDFGRKELAKATHLVKTSNAHPAKRQPSGFSLSLDLHDDEDGDNMEFEKPDVEEEERESIEENPESPEGNLHSNFNYDSPRRQIMDDEGSAGAPSPLPPSPIFLGKQKRNNSNIGAFGLSKSHRFATYALTLGLAGLC